MERTSPSPRSRALAFIVASTVAIALASSVTAAPPRAAQDAVLPSQRQPVSDLDPQIAARARLLTNPPPAQRRSVSLAGLSQSQLTKAIDAYWGEGAPTAEKLAIFDKFWEYADAHYAAFQGIHIDWPAERRRYRHEVAGGVSRGRFAAIMNQLSLALHDTHSLALDELVNIGTVPDRGVPLFGVGGWMLDTSGACLTAQRDGSALVYSAMADHPLGLEPGDRVLGYDGVPWRILYRRLLRAELPLWPIPWGSSRSAFEHTFVMSAALNWHLFQTMDIAKHATATVVHMPTSLMPGPLFYGFCAEELDIPGVPKPSFFAGDFATGGIVDGTNVGYVYDWSFKGDARADFDAVVRQLTQVDHVDGLIIDLRYNEGGFINAPFDALGEIASRPRRTIAMDGRAAAGNHFAMKEVFPPSEFLLDYAYDSDGTKRRVPASYDGPVAVLVGPGAASAGDIAAILASYLPHVRTFGKSTAMAVGLPTQPILGTELDLGPDWFARVAETNAFRVRSPGRYLIHDEFPVDERVWLRPGDVAAGKDTVVENALRWLRRHGAA